MKKHSCTLLAAASLAAWICNGGALAATNAQKCESGKNKERGKYSLCRLKAAAKLITTGDAVKYGTDIVKCDAKLALKWGNLEAPGGCPTNGDLATIQELATEDATTASTMLSGADPDPKMKLPLVRAYTGCTSPNDGISDGLLYSLPACSTSTPLDAQMSLSPSGGGTVEISRIDGPDMKVKVVLEGVLKDGSPSNDPLKLSTSARVTGNLCTTNPCTVIDSIAGTGSVAIPCTAGVCSVTATLNDNVGDPPGTGFGSRCCVTSSAASGCLTEGTPLCDSDADCTNPSYPTCVKLIRSGKQAVTEILSLKISQTAGGPAFLVPGFEVP